MLDFKKVMLALVFSCLMLLSIPQIAASSVEFDNSEFVSDLTSEEKEEIETKEKEEDFKTYQETVELRDEYKNFAGFDYFIADEKAFEELLQTTYDTMAESTFDDETKNEYYVAMIGNKENPGLLYQIYDFNKLLKYQNENSELVVDCTAAVEILESYGVSKPNVNNIEYINMFAQLLTDLDSSFEPIKVSSATPEELQTAMQSNIIFTNELNSLYKQLEYYSQPKTKLIQRVSHSSVIMNIGLLAAIVILFVVRFPIVKKQQIYVWDEFKPLTLLTIPLIGSLFFVFFTWFFNPSFAVENPFYDIYMNGMAITPTDRVYTNQEGQYTFTLVAQGSDMTVASTSFTINVTDDSTLSSTKSELPTWNLEGYGLAEFSNTGNNNIVLPISDDKYDYYTVKEVIDSVGIEVDDNFEPDQQTMEFYVDYNRNEFILPMQIRLVIPALLFGTLYFMFLLMPKRMVKTYLNELYTINKFCGFLSYNMAYRSNARVLIEETLQSLDSCKFAEDFAIIFFEKDRVMTDKIHDISQIYSFKFFEMYLGIVNIIFDEGVSESTLKSLSIIQQFGDEYYNQADMFFKSKKGAISALIMIIGICVCIPLIVKVKMGVMFALFLNTASAYTTTLGCYLVWFGLVCLIFNMYKDNKIVRAEGRYA